MNELWAVVMWDAELEKWHHRTFYYKEAAKKGMIDWVRAQFETWELDYVMRKNDEQEIEFVNDDARALGVVKDTTAVLDVGCRKNIEWHMFRVG